MMPLLSDAPAASRTDAPIRVLLADDHEITVWGLRQVIDSASPRMVVSGTAGSCAELLGHPALASTDVILLDLGLRDACSLDLLPRLGERTAAKVVVLTADLNPARHRDAVLAGARGVVLKTQPIDTVLGAVQRVHAGEVWLEGSLMSLLISELQPKPASPASSPPAAADLDARRIASLTRKEIAVIQAIVKHRGAKSLVVAESLAMSEHTLRNHLTVIYGKLGVQGKLDLYVYATEHRLVPAAP
jgi:DNA-binding NarL/FixJ family response regulator